MQQSPENNLIKWWEKLNKLPVGNLLFSIFLGLYTPYSGSISARVESLSTGQARVSIRDRRKLRNHLKSVHAAALINLGEIATGLAVLSTIPGNMRGIVLGLEAEYIKKARGKLTAIANFELPENIDDNTPVKVTTEISDQKGDLVARVHARWLLGMAK